MRDTGPRVVGAGVAVLVAAALAGCAPAPEPAFSVDDGLPDELAAGETYVARVTITFPDDWPEADETGRVALVGMIVDLGTGAEALVCDSQGVLPEDLPSVTLTCEFAAEAPSRGVEVIAQAAEADAYSTDEVVHGIWADQVYQHTVAPTP